MEKQRYTFYPYNQMIYNLRTCEHENNKWFLSLFMRTNMYLIISVCMYCAKLLHNDDDNIIYIYSRVHIVNVRDTI